MFIVILNTECGTQKATALSAGWTPSDLELCMEVRDPFLVRHERESPRRWIEVPGDLPHPLLGTVVDRRPHGLLRNN